jgi:SWIM zinc finger
VSLPAAGANAVTTVATMPAQRLETLGGAPICARLGCGRPLPSTRPHGSPRRYCSPRCRFAAWRAAHLAQRSLPPLGLRLVRALSLKVVAVEVDLWRVDGGQSAHLVGPAGCDCRDHAVRGGPCKHALAVALARCAPELRAAVQAALLPVALSERQG